jgi:hypothetical protein
MNDIPWRDAAVLLLRRDHGAGERDIVAEGTLRDLVDRIATAMAGDIPRMTISLPDRRAPPFRYEGTKIHELVRSRNAGGAVLMPMPARRRRAVAPPPALAG